MKKVQLILYLLLFGISSIYAQQQATCIIGRNAANSNPSSYAAINGQNLDVSIANAIAAGYRNIKINMGSYFVTKPIILTGGGITLEGSGASTYIQPKTISLDAIIRLNSSNNTIKDLGITSYDGITPLATQHANSAILIEAGANNNILENINIGRYQGNNQTPTNRILVRLASGQATNNRFNNIYFYKSDTNIELNVTGTGTFSSNTFNNIHLHGFVQGISFTGSGGTINNNIFNNIEAQCNSSSRNIISNVRGKANTFKNLNHADWNIPNSAQTTSFIINLTNEAFETVINNFETASKDEKYNSDIAVNMNNKWYHDLGRGTQFINNANTNRVNQHIVEEVSNVTYTGATGTSIFNVEDVNTIIIKPKNTSPIVKDKVLTSVNADGTVAWQTPSTGNTVSNLLNGTKLTTTINGITSNELDFNNIHKTLYTSDSRIVGTELNTPNNAANEGGNLPEHNNRVVFMIDGWIAKSNFLKFSKDENDASNVMYLHTTTIEAGNNDQNCVIIGANARANGEANNIATTRYHLLVNGKIKAKDEVLISNTGTWADYVFNKDYALKPLSEVETYIKENGHLPNMPSASIIEKEGLPLASIKTKQQEKIEELTLYAIEQEKVIANQDKQFESIKNQIEKLKKTTNNLINKN